ncbi:uncharacterized protein [Dendropsophus ebraccatus]|uniref:uncharacterized protein n=1 Tax=Dendropsophus ebraccatus TaxID=150705 RepID=UPI00383117EC
MESLFRRQTYAPSNPPAVKLNAHLAKLLVLQALMFKVVDSAPFRELMLCAEPRWKRRNGLPNHCLICDIATRWNSTLHMLDRLYEQRKALTDFLLMQADTATPLCNLELEQWHVMCYTCRNKLCDFIHPYREELGAQLVATFGTRRSHSRHSHQGHTSSAASSTSSSSSLGGMMSMIDAYVPEPLDYWLYKRYKPSAVSTICRKHPKISCRSSPYRPLTAQHKSTTWLLSLMMLGTMKYLMYFFLLRCAIGCKRPKIPLHGDMNCTHPGDTLPQQASCHFTCEKGYTLKGPSTVQCAATEEWTGESPMCEPILLQIIQPEPLCTMTAQCDRPEQPKNGSMSCVNSEEMLEYNSVCTFTCDKGFSMVGSPSTQCSATGQWTEMPPKCQVTGCKHSKILYHYMGQGWF